MSPGLYTKFTKMCDVVTACFVRPAQFAHLPSVKQSKRRERLSLFAAVYTEFM